jgi:hypothetical protein
VLVHHHEARHERLALRVDDLGILRRFHLAALAERHDEALVDHQGLVTQGLGAGAIDYGGVGKRDDRLIVGDEILVRRLVGGTSLHGGEQAGDGDGEQRALQLHGCPPSRK